MGEHSGAILEQWDFDGGDYQRWELTLLENGYYKICSVESGYAITVPTGSESSSVDLKQLSYSGSNTQQWGITPTSDGRYKIKAKSSEDYTTSDLVMRVNTQGIHSANGLNIRQMAYTNDNEYSDEWKIIQCSASLNTVPTYLTSNASHFCIPCAITNVAGYWCLNGYSFLNCSSNTQQDIAATAVSAAMDAAAGNSSGHFANAYIPDGFNYFTSNNSQYSFVTQSIWNNRSGFSIDDIIEEIYYERPLLLGFADTENCPYEGAHMTVCVGYEIDSSGIKIVVSDANVLSYHSYCTWQFRPDDYNDFICKVSLIQE